MNILAALVLGLLIGWLIEWVIDWIYWRNRTRALAEQKEKLARENLLLKDRVAALEPKANKRSQLAKTRPFGKGGKDNLKAIRGIGPVIERRLNQAGIYTFEEMAQLTPDELTDILGDLIRKFFPGEDKMIAQAKEFAQHKPQDG
jgi:predicted flap endonuclease-1-like 5' DNA nuclease